MPGSNNLLSVLLSASLFLVTPLLTHAQQPARDTLPPPKVQQLSEISIIQQKALVERKTDRLIYNVTSSVGAAGANGLEVMARVPGLRVTDNLIAIAGKGAVKVMVNGRIIPLAGEDLQRYLKSMSAGEIARVEVITNPSAAYDADGNAGLINIVTRRDRNQGFNGEIQAGGKLSDYGFKKLYGVSNYGTMSAGGNFSYNTPNGRCTVTSTMNMAASSKASASTCNIQTGSGPRQTPAIIRSAISTWCWVQTTR
ncbi:hypothetical protein HF324_17445 [Chitinophaga oryzae]|uniref:TonB-dependent receptor plug domain-containing protein n=1 Tax=Chitinophaga oryzae TaxID=2725414 RepID=A0ABX6LHD9_9BACT|nr:hypothetical protein [Chitinophaga oryzae]QJB39544.1 hypothetical protein HF324_17445 [Chitinophaga oryzae]